MSSLKRKKRKVKYCVYRSWTNVVLLYIHIQYTRTVRNKKKEEEKEEKRRILVCLIEERANWKGLREKEIRCKLMLRRRRLDDKHTCHFRIISVHTFAVSILSVAFYWKYPPMSRVLNTCQDGFLLALASIQISRQWIIVYMHTTCPCCETLFDHVSLRLCISKRSVHARRIFNAKLMHLLRDILNANETDISV